MSKLTVTNNFGSKSSQRSVKTKDSLVSKKSRYSGSLVSEHGSRFGRAVNRFPRANDPGLVQTMSVENSRVVRTVFNPLVSSGSKLPDLAETTATDSIRELGKCLNILDYEFNYASFWLLDVLSKHLKDLQLKNFSPSHQETFLSWFRFVLRCISITGSSREEIFTLLQEMFKSAVEIIQESSTVPLPEDIDIRDSPNITPKLSAELKTTESFKSSSKESTTSRKGRKRTLSQKSLRKSSNNSGHSKKSVSRKSSVVIVDKLVNDKEDVKKLNMEVFRTIIDMLYQIFADRFAFMMTSLAYSSPNMITLVDLQVTFNDPKPLKTEPDPPLPSPAKADTPKSGTKGAKVKLDSGKKKGRKSRGSSLISTDKGTETSDEKKNKKDKKGKKGKGDKDRTPSSKKEKETSEKSKSFADLENVSTEEIKDSKIKATKTKEGKRKKSKERMQKKSKTSDASVEKENKSAKSKRGKEKGKPKKEAEDGEENDDQTKGKSGGKPAKSGNKKKKSTLISLEVKKTSLDDKQEALKKLEHQFDRLDCSGMKKEPGVNNKFIFPLSDAIDKNYVENLLCSLLPPEVQKEVEPKLMEEKIKRDSGRSRSSRRSSVKGQKKKPKSKKKK